ncbi:MAG TPA: hypothetical protein VI757_16465 [Bacteroidia bacterium]|nr:hypothetical protein [Bacteroidia bacterium]
MKPFTKIAAVIFGIVALIHICRLATHFPVVIGSYEISQGVSIAAIIILPVLCVGLWRESNK